MKDFYKNQSYLYFDIETIPCQTANIIEKFRYEVTPPKALKRADSINKWLDENRESSAQAALAKTSFDGGLGHVCTIAWADDDGSIVAAHAKNIEQELGIIDLFFSGVKSHQPKTLVGHNINGFDIQFLLKRAIVLGVKIPSGFPRDPKPWSQGVHDTMYMWAGNKGTVSMDKLCGILGITGKEGFDGSMVAAAWARGDHKTIAEYCKSDVEKIRLIHQKFLQADW